MQEGGEMTEGGRRKASVKRAFSLKATVGMARCLME